MTDNKIVYMDNEIIVLFKPASPYNRFINII
ncbi:hypothetical protein [Campylobacter phage CJLB-7]|nr:hypothetical protein [Campylobacter phage CJLB-7]